nr:N-carbamoylputrescine amidase [Endozoicomonas sp. ONNA2]
MRNVTVATVQASYTWDLDNNLNKAEQLVREAAARGAQIILLSELFQAPYFCIQTDEKHFALAQTLAQSQVVNHFKQVASELEVVLPISFFERQNQALYNSIAIIDADGNTLGIYRKTHIPDSPGYCEKFFFTPGDTGFQVWNTRYATIGVAICWDQWFPESARAMALMGAELLFFPTAIGSEPQDATLVSTDHWQVVQRGHAAANIMPLIAANRVGKETHSNVFDAEAKDVEITFYGSSFISDEHGQMVKAANKTDECVLVHRFDLDAIQKTRTSWGLFRDRRPEMYHSLLSCDGVHTCK